MEEKTKKKFYQKWWFWTLIVILTLIVLAESSENTNTSNTENNDSSSQIYTIQGEQLGDYGTIITLNANTDMPTKKYLYKLPAGTYEATTTSENTVSLSIVKDETTTENSDYPEILNYVTNPENISGDKNKIGKANIKESIEINLKDDESICINGTGEITFKSK